MSNTWSWEAFLSKKKFEDDELTEACRRATFWDSCLVMEICPELETNDNCLPDDMVMRVLGDGFNYAVDRFRHLVNVGETEKGLRNRIEFRDKIATRYKELCDSPT